MEYSTRSRRAPRWLPRMCWISGPGTAPGPWVISRHGCRPWTCQDLSSETQRTHAYKAISTLQQLIQFSKYHDPSQWKGGEQACMQHMHTCTVTGTGTYLQVGHLMMAVAVLQVWSTKDLQRNKAQINNTMSMQLALVDRSSPLLMIRV